MRTLFLWDLDKTLIDVAGHTDYLLDTVLSKYNIDYYSNIISLFRNQELEGRPIKERLVKIFGEDIGSKIFNDYKLQNQVNTNYPKLFKGIKDLISSLGKSSINIIVTNKDYNSVEESLKQNNVFNKFDKLVTSNDVLGDYLRLKPAPDLIEIAVKEFEKDYIIMIGDTANDINSLLSLDIDCKKLGILAGWGNNQGSLNAQKNRINGVEGTHYIVVKEVQDLEEYLRDFV